MIDDPSTSDAAQALETFVALVTIGITEISTGEEVGEDSMTAALGPYYGAFDAIEMMNRTALAMHLAGKNDEADRIRRMAEAIDGLLDVVMMGAIAFSHQTVAMMQSGGVPRDQWNAAWQKNAAQIGAAIYRSNTNREDKQQ